MHMCVDTKNKIYFFNPKFTSFVKKKKKKDFTKFSLGIGIMCETDE